MTIKLIVLDCGEFLFGYTGKPIVQVWVTREAAHACNRNINN
jgi:hypothetical protein